MTKFKGETREEAIINHFGLDIDEENAFFNFITEMGYDLNAEDEIIENLYKMWEYDGK